MLKDLFVSVKCRLSIGGVKVGSSSLDMVLHNIRGARDDSGPRHGFFKDFSALE